jgi:hypothetical protein
MECFFNICQRAWLIKRCLTNDSFVDHINGNKEGDITLEILCNMGKQSTLPVRGETLYAACHMAYAIKEGCRN